MLVRMYITHSLSSSCALTLWQSWVAYCQIVKLTSRMKLHAIWFAFRGNILGNNLTKIRFSAVDFICCYYIDYNYGSRGPGGVSPVRSCDCEVVSMRVYRWLPNYYFTKSHSRNNEVAILIASGDVVVDDAIWTTISVLSRYFGNKTSSDNIIRDRDFDTEIEERISVWIITTIFWRIFF